MPSAIRKATSIWQWMPKAARVFSGAVRTKVKRGIFKTLPVGLPQDNRPPYTSLGYTTVRQSPNGIIHILATKDFPGLHYEFNETWLWSDEGDIQPETTGGKVRSFKEYYKDGKVKSEWGARICPNGRYLLDGVLTDYYPDGALQHQAFYQSGRKNGREIFMNPHRALQHVLLLGCDIQYFLYHKAYRRV